jgi:HAD superfamily hydrolase (TIGR01509 family)
MVKKVCFFDMDGTLIDSMTRAWREVILRFLDERGISYPDDIITNLVTKGFMGIAKHYVEHFGVDMTPEALYDWFMVELESMYQHSFPLKEGAKELLISLKNQGYEVNVISGSPLRFVVPCFKRLGIYDIIDNILSIEEFKLTKSDKELFIKLAEKTGAKVEDCIVFDDSVHAIKTAKSAGLQTVGIYEEAVKNTWSEMQEIADKTIKSFYELL